MKNPHSPSAIERLATVGLIVIVVIVGVAALYSLPSVLRGFGTETVHLRIQVSYSGSWNGSYTLNPCSSTAIKVQWGGVGPQEKEITFQGNINTGIGFYAQFQKQDNSSAVLSVTVHSDRNSHVPSQSNSTAAPFGTMGFGRCSIAYG